MLDFSSIDKNHLVRVCRNISALISKLRKNREGNQPDLVTSGRIREIGSIQIEFLEKLLLATMTLIADVDD